MSPSAAWTVALADTDNISHPTTAYVVTAAGRAEAIASVTAQHTAITSIPADRVLIVEACPGTPPADAWYGWSDLRGIKALRVVVEPEHVRRIARLRMRLRRWRAAMQSHFEQQARDDCYEIPPQAWNEYLDEATAIAENLTRLLHDDPATSAETPAAAAQQHEPWPRLARQTDRAYQQYVACFPDATQALLHLSRTAGIAVAYMDRGYIEADRGAPLTDEQWEEIRFRLETYDEHVSYTDSNSLYLDQIFTRADIPRWPDDDTADSGDEAVEP